MVGDTKEFNELVEKLQNTKTWSDMKLNNIRLSKIIGVTDRTFYRWIKGQSKVPLTVIYLLRLLLKDFKRV